MADAQIPKLQYWPFYPSHPDFGRMMEMAVERFGDIGYVGNDGEEAYFQIRGDNTPYTIPISEFSSEA